MLASCALAGCSTVDDGSPAARGDALVPVCGDGVREGCEVCDDGAQNGEANRCDAACQFTCEGNCPIRVNPDADPGGDGTTWGDAMGDLQAALDLQSGRGGGDVWVLGGRFERLTAPGTTALLDIPSHVALRGGFEGHELRLEQRNNTAPRTVFLRSEPGFADPPPRPHLVGVIGQSDVLLERVSFEQGFSALKVTGSTYVIIRDSSLGSQTERDYAPFIDIDSSDVRFERSFFTVSTYSDWMSAQQSRVAIVDSDIGALDNYTAGWLAFDQSQLLLERSRFGVDFYPEPENHFGLHLTGSQALILDSAFRGGSSRGSVLTSDADSTLLLVGSRFRYMTTGTEPITSAHLFAFNTSFGDSAGHRLETAAVMAVGGTLEIAASTFYRNGCLGGPPEPGYECGDVDFRGTDGLVHNTLFIDSQVPSRVPIEGTPALSGNCYATSASFEFGAPWANQVLAQTHPCRDGGDAEELEASRQRMLTLAAPFRAAPFQADLSAYDSADWWPNQTLLANQCTDEGAPDPGQHYDLSCSQ